MTTIVDTGLLAQLTAPPAGGGPSDPDLNTGAGYWASFTENFVTLDTATKWDQYGAAKTVTNNEVRIPVTQYSGINTKALLNITDSSVHFKADLANATGSAAIYCQLRSGGLDDRYLQVAINKSAGTYNIVTAGNAIASTQLGTGTYNAAQMLWWRFKHRTARNQLIVESSPDGVTWTERGAGSIPSGYTLNSTDLQLATQDNASGYVAYSKVNL